MENINSNLVGLTDSEVQKRIDEGKVNISTNIKTKSIEYFVITFLRFSIL